MKKKIKIHPKYKRLLTTKKRYSIVTGGRGCFNEGTLVITDNKSKQIQDIIIGDKVLSYNETKHINEFKRVKDVFCYDIDETIIKITLSNGKTIEATKDHKFFFNGHWEPLDKIVSLWKKKTCRRIRSNRTYNQRHYNWSQLELAEIVKVEYLNDVKKVYDISVSDNSNYYLDCGKPILVHNSGKSFSITMLICLLLLSERRNVLFLRKTLTSAHLSIIPEFKDKIELLGLSDLFYITKTEIINLANNSVIYFRGIQSSSSDNTANLKSLKDISVVVFDEVDELTDEDTFDRIDLSVRQKGITNKIILVLNPPTKEHWVYKRFYEGLSVNSGFNGECDNVSYIHTDYFDNIKNLSDSFIEQAERMKEKNPSKYKHIMLGEWADKAEGVIFNNWKIGEFKDTGNTIFAQDYGFSIDPTTLIEVSLDSDKRIIYVKEHLYKTGLTTTDIYENNLMYAGDNLIVGDSAESRLISELKEKGNNIIGAKKETITAGIALLQDYDIIVDPNSKNLIKELNNYKWSNKVANKPIDTHNHCIDPLRYSIIHLLGERDKADVFVF